MPKRVLWGVTLLSLIISILLGNGTVTTQAQLSGTSRLDLIAIPIPCSLINEIKLDTPCEMTFLKWDIESIIGLNLTVGGLTYAFHSAISIAGLEHFILSLDAKLGSMVLKPELWFAVPFETVTDANNLLNTVVIPPGQPLFVKKRLTLEADVFGLKFKNLAMFEDVTFPDPGSDYGTSDCDGDGEVEGTCVGGVETNDALHYENQAFAFGDIITISGQTVSGISYSSQTGLCAELGSNRVKKYSASGKVDPDCAGKGFKFSFEKISVSGIEIGAMRLGSSLSITPTSSPPIQVTTSISLPISGLGTLSTSITGIPLEMRFGRISLAISSEPLSLNLNFSSEGEFGWTGSANFRGTFSVGTITTVLSSIASFGSSTGMSSLSLGLSITTGAFSADHNVAFTRQDEGLKFTSLNIRFSLKVSPAVFSINPVFGRNGLTRLAISASVVF